MRRQLRSFVVLAAGLAAVGASGFVVLGTADRVLDARQALSVSVLWTLVNTVAPAILLPVEQEIARSVAAREVAGAPWVHDVAPLCAIAGVLTSAMCTVGLILAPQLSRALFGGQAVAVVAAAAIVCSFALQHVFRGVFSGLGLITRYGVQLLVDGMLRALAVLALAASGTASLTTVAMALVAAPLASVMVTLPLGLWRQDRAASVWRPSGTQTRAIGTLIAAQAANSLVVGGGGVAAGILAGHDETAVATGVVGVLVFARLPLLLFYAVQPMLIPQFARLGGTRQWGAFRRYLTTAQVAVTVTGLTIAAAGWIAGPVVTHLIYGTGFRASRLDVTAALVGVTACIAATVSTQALLAIRRYASTMAVWIGSAAVFVGTLCASIRPLDRHIFAAFVTAGLVAAVAGTLLAHLVIRRQVAADLRALAPVPLSCTPQPAAKTEVPAGVKP